MMANAGRPSKYDSIDLGQVEKLAGLGLIDTEIAMVLGIATSTLNEYKKNPEFSESIKRGKLIADKEVIESLYKRAVRGDTTAIIFWLKNRQPDKWRDRQEHAISSRDFEITFRKPGKPKVKGNEKDSD